MLNDDAVFSIMENLFSTSHHVLVYACEAAATPHYTMVAELKPLSV